jgi:D-alanine-D-alanine ligase
MKGLCRADFIYKNEKAYFLEINSIPGLTEESILPKQIMTAGIKIEDIIHDMVISL